MKPCSGRGDLLPAHLPLRTGLQGHLRLAEAEGHRGGSAALTLTHTHARVCTLTHTLSHTRSHTHTHTHTLTVTHTLKHKRLQLAPGEPYLLYHGSMDERHTQTTQTHTHPECHNLLSESQWAPSVACVCTWSLPMHAIINRGGEEEQEEDSLISSPPETVNGSPADIGPISA